MKKTRHYDLVHTLFVLFIIIMIFTRKRYTIIYQDFTNPMFLFFLFIFTIFSYWGLNHDKNDVKRGRIKRVMSKSIRDYFVACIEDEAPSLRPYCGSCGTQLNEDYYCEDCKRQCLCTHIKCEDSQIYG